MTTQRNATGTDAAEALAKLGKKKATPSNNLKGAEVTSPVTKWVHKKLSETTPKKNVVAAKLPKAVVDHVNKAKVNNDTGFSPAKKFRNDSDSAVRGWVKAYNNTAKKAAVKANAKTHAFVSVTTNVVVDNTAKVTTNDAVAYTVTYKQVANKA